MNKPQAAPPHPPRRILTRESRTERAAWAFTDQRPIDPNDPHDTRDEYLSLSEHQELLAQARAEARKYKIQTVELRAEMTELLQSYKYREKHPERLMAAMESAETLLKYIYDKEKAARGGASEKGKA